MNAQVSGVRKELRFLGLLLDSVVGDFSEKRLKATFASSRRRPMRLWEPAIAPSEEHIVRPDGSRMRLLVLTPRRPRPRSAQGTPGVLWFHGGGYGLGAPEQAGFFAKNMFAVADCVVLSPDYRLSIQAPYPAAIDDCYAALLWMRENAARLGINRDQLMVGGDSAGGGLAAALALRARDEGRVQLAFQMPLYPMLDDRRQSESATGNRAPVWNSARNEKAWRHYLGELFGGEVVPIYAAPARAQELAGLPPALTFVGDLEPFRDETISYVERLRAAGVPTDFRLFEGCYHAFDQLARNSRVSKEAVSFFQDSFRFAVEHYFAEN